MNSLMKGVVCYSLVALILSISGAFLPASGFDTLPATEIREIKVGQKVPDILLEKIGNYPKGTARISELYKKNLIIDFWATWCTVCVQKLPEISKLQQQFKNELNFLLVTSDGAGDDHRKVTNFLDKYAKMKGISLKIPFVAEDTTLTTMFRHISVPHYIWIDKQGVVKAITSSEEISEKNVSDFLQGRNINAKPRYQFPDFSYNSPILLNPEMQQYKKDLSIISQSLITGYIDGVQPRNTVNYNKDKKVVHVAYMNRPLIALFQTAHSFNEPENKVILKVKDKEPFISRNTPIEGWETHKLYCYEWIGAPVSAMKQLSILKKDIQDRLGYTATVEKRSIPCYVLRSKEKVSRQGTTASNDSTYKFVDLVAGLNNYSKLPIVNEALSDFRIDKLLFDQIRFDEPKWRAFLQENGIQITTENRLQDVMIIRETAVNE